MSPLGHSQAAPAGFNLLTLLMVRIAGISERSLRFFPLLCGLIAIFVFWRLSRRWLHGWALLFANYTFAIANKLIYFSNEFKPYILDVLLAMTVVLGLTSWWEDGRPRNRLPLLAVTGCVAVWFSFPVVLVMAGVGSVVLAACWIGRRYADFWKLIAVVVTWVISFGCQYVFFSRQVMKANGEVLTNYWRAYGAFMPLRPWEHPAWFATSFFDYFDRVAGLRLSFNALQFIFICGLIELVRRKASMRLCVLLAPIAVSMLVSGLELYPFKERMILFTVPFALLICGEGVEGLLKWLRPPQMCIIMVGVALCIPTAQAFYLIWHPKKREEVRPLAEYLQHQATSQDVVFVLDNNPTFLYYTRVLQLKQTMLPFTEKDYATVLPQITYELQQGRHCWLVTSHVKNGEQASVLSHLKSVCQLRAVDQQPEAQLLALDPL